MEKFESKPIEVTRLWKDKLFQHKLSCNDRNRNAYKHIIGGTLIVFTSFMVVGHKRCYFITQLMPTCLGSYRISEKYNIHIHLN